MKLLRLAELAKSQQVALWNEAFADYLVPATLTEASFEARMASLYLSADDSLVVEIDGEFAGFALTGTRIFQSRKIAWIGGIAIIPRFRKQGLARQLMEALITTYSKENVTESWLEVISNNHAAIRLYESLGYQKTTDLIFLNGNLQDYGKAGIQLKKRVSESLFEKNETPWQNLISEQTQAASIWRNRQLLGDIIYRVSDKSITLLQINLDDSSQILDGLQAFFNRYGALPCMISNQETDKAFIPILLQNGFTEVAKQIQMRKVILDGEIM
ncbi:hypothetical protein PGRAN_03865 [Listeria grandensis FSL F6-0971]|uniref:N-acetyltransferase domain-containing protein n=1 Tax=Listeria grandensis FSL F6-0971 TaxID=1265819 RepID=W7BXE1_9LIST|nr:GNAT family N-acetyltransferase [Listeria grandensis]EUJ24988.1 hypothetical protein PGRAN_03865 [Listeria grandensis FSL F6-0971]